MRIGGLISSLGVGVVTLGTADGRDAVPVVRSLPQDAASGRVLYDFDELPPGIVQRATPAYPESAWIAGLEGRVVVIAQLDRTGKVTEARIQRGPQVFAQAALEAVRKWTFTPANVHGRPIAVAVQIPVRFRLDEPSPSEGAVLRSLAERPPTRRVDFGCPPDSSHSNNVQRHTAHARVDSIGRVREVRFAPAAPPDANAVRAAILGWEFTPLQAAGEPGARDQTEIWVRIPIVRSCPPAEPRASP